SAQAAEGTLGTESPYIYCTYTDADGNSADGNNLSAGTYKVTFNIKDMASAAVIQLTVSYADTVSVDSSTVTQLSDADTNFSSMGYLASDGNIVFGYVSNEDGASALNAEGTALFSIDMTFSQACDAADVITISSDPNLTFATADYGDGYDDEYALVDAFDGYNGSLYLMTADVSPASSFDISGQITIATDITGASTTIGIVGINVSVLKDGSTVAQATTDENGNYTLSAVPAGEYTMLISGDTTVDREVTLIVTESKTVDSVGIVVCDYNRDLYFNSYDTVTFVKGLNEYNVYCDLNGDDYVNSYDTLVFINFLDKTINYDDVTLQ
ncbi:MAG: carboxypeptidase-like regulatory domain-containing protein, partial [Eubacteriales bacterium]|nr:carboxypeptidase-like regulatory domain-containing protein [Eubacteriales bacterium]